MAHFNIAKDDLRTVAGNLGTFIKKTLVFEDNASGTRVWEFEFEKGTIQKTEWYAEQEFIDSVTEQRNNNIGKKFDDKEAVGTKVATVPMHIWAREVAPRNKDGNDSSIRKWLNSDEAKPFRTKEGNL